MSHGSDRVRLEEVIRLRGFRPAVTLIIMAAMPAAIKQYFVQEVLVVLITIALVFVPILFVAVMFILLQEGLPRVLRSLKTNTARLAVWSELPLRTIEELSGTLTGLSRVAGMDLTSTDPVLALSKPTPMATRQRRPG
jgi:hypothetical protein